MNPKVIFLMYGVFAVGSNYHVKAQIISTLTGDVTPSQDKYANENFSQLAAIGGEQGRMVERSAEEEIQEHSRAPSSKARNEDWQSNSGLIYYCRFSDQGLKKLVC